MKKALKRGLSLLLAITIIFSSAYVGLSEVDFDKIDFREFFAVKAKAASESDLTFTLSSDGTYYSVTDCDTSASGSLTIPATYNGKPVTSIGDRAFEDRTSLTSITIPDSVTYIDDDAFRGCKGLTSIDVDESNEHYSSADDVLFNKNKTKLICYPAGRTNTSYSIPNSVTSIGYYAFEYCTSLTSIAIPDSVTYIGFCAFNECTSLVFVTIPDSVTYIDDDAFNDCTSLTSITIPDSVISIGYAAFASCENLMCVTISDSITSIDEWTFGNCTSLTSVTIPDSVTSIGDNAFYNCTSLSDVYYGGTEDDWGNISIGSSNSCLTNATIHYHEHKLRYDGVCVYCGDAPLYTYRKELSNIIITGYDGSEEDIIIPSSIKGYPVTEIAYGAFMYKSFNSVVIPEGVRIIGSDAFKGGRINSIVIPHSVNSIHGGGLDTSNYTDVFYVGWESGWEYIYNDVFYDQDGNIVYEVDVHYRCRVENIGTCVSGLTTTYTCPDCSESLSYTTKQEHDFIDGRCSVCYLKEELLVESSHPYENNLNKEYVISKPNAKSITIVFSDDTELENSYDTLYIYDKNDILVGTYTGTTLQEKAITVTGDSVKIVLETDHSVTKYGFKVVDVVAEFENCSHSKQVVEGKIDPTCTESGMSGNTYCDYCDELIKASQWVSSLGHNYSTEYTIDKEATCTEDGSKSHYCIVCGDKTDVTVIEATGHSYGEWIVALEPTCTEDGSRSKTCPGCGDVVTEEISATGHINTMWVTEKEPTCSEEGYKDLYCLDCTELIDTESIPVTEHDFDEWYIDVYPSCTEDGSEYRQCKVCKYREEGIMLATGHFNTYWVTKVEPTCTETGYKELFCDVCSKAIDSESIPATGHNYSTEWTIDLAPTCTEAGSKSHHCTVCDDKTDVTAIASLGHDFKIISTAEEHPHTISYKCSRCIETKQETSTSATCAVCNFSYTNIDSATCKITGYIGSADSFVIPANISGRAVTTTTTGAFKNNTTLTSVRIENGVQGLGSLAFLGCKSLSKIVIPESVTSIGANAFYNCASDFTIYCYGDTYAMQYAIDNSLNYVVMDIGETENSRIDYDNELIFVSEKCITSLDDILYVPSTGMAFAEASHIAGNYEFLGTGSIVTVFDGSDISSEYTIVVEGDINGDSVCDGLDVAQIALASNGHENLDGAYAMAADTNYDNMVDVNDYQSIVNKAVA